MHCPPGPALGTKSLPLNCKVRVDWPRRLASVPSVYDLAIESIVGLNTVESGCIWVATVRLSLTLYRQNSLFTTCHYRCFYSVDWPQPAVQITDLDGSFVVATWNLKSIGIGWITLEYYSASSTHRSPIKTGYCCPALMSGLHNLHRNSTVRHTPQRWNHTHRPLPLRFHVRPMLVFLLPMTTAISNSAMPIRINSNICYEDCPFALFEHHCVPCYFLVLIWPWI